MWPRLHSRRAFAARSKTAGSSFTTDLCSEANAGNFLKIYAVGSSLDFKQPLTEKDMININNLSHHTLAVPFILAMAGVMQQNQQQRQSMGRRARRQRQSRTGMQKMSRRRNRR